MTLPKIGNLAPLFALPDHTGTEHALKAYRGKPVLLYFYPKALTPGCTVQACSLRDSQKELAKRGIQVFGISPDAPKLLAKFVEKEKLNFTLLSDLDHTVADKYGVPLARAGEAYAELALLRGDPSDGLPGVPGVGEKTAATMLTRYGSLATILTAAQDPKSDLPKAFRAKVLAAMDYIEAAGPVVRVARDAPVHFYTDSDALPSHPADPKRVAELAEAYGIGSPIARLQKALEAITTQH